MAIKYERIKDGDVLYDVHRTKMGNTTMSRLGCWTVMVIRLHDDGATVSWNSNAATFYTRRRLEKLRRAPPKGL